MDIPVVIEGCWGPWTCHGWSDKTPACFNVELMKTEHKLFKYSANCIFSEFKASFSDNSNWALWLKPSYTLLFSMSCCFNMAISVTKSVNLFSLLSLDRFADSRLDCILFLFFSSIIMAYRASTSICKLVGGREVIFFNPGTRNFALKID